MIRLVKPYIAFEDVEDEIREIFSTGIFTKGAYSKLLPAKLSEYTGAQHAFLASSATTALTMCLNLLNIGPGDEVIVSDFSFPASANVVEDLGATTVLADVSLETYNMLPGELLARITPRTKAVIFVDALGNPSGLDEIAALCKDQGIPLIEDAACAFGSSIDGRKIGSVSDLTCFSMHPRKLLTTGEGGAITTNNDDYASTLRIKLNHGANEQGDYVTFGYNYRMPEIACVMGCYQVEKIDVVIKERRQQYAAYAEYLTPLGFVPQSEAENAYSNRQSVVFTVPSGIQRDALVAALKEKQIETTLGTYSLSTTTYYKNKYQEVLPNAHWLQKHTITLPCYQNLPLEEVCRAVEQAVHSL
ncbi:MAG: DegT/DnrJ/EryC1/StrS family aminotransferase [Coriobacteriia bacterium]|nr:DegT/DnrJ/EryC1/StrS family aminotransferase [Coriobacteriia bacterium]MCL2749756.1 DegT/DnrJ/EryC1/StrS family aminotransferase [Coriobacteriia bacterium]